MKEKGLLVIPQESLRSEYLSELQFLKDYDRISAVIRLILAN